MSYSKMTYVHLDWLVYEDTDILIMLRIAREYVYHGVHMPLLPENYQCQMYCIKYIEVLKSSCTVL